MNFLGQERECLMAPFWLPVTTVQTVQRFVSAISSLSLSLSLSSLFSLSPFHKRTNAWLKSCTTYTQLLPSSSSSKGVSDKKGTFMDHFCVQGLRGDIKLSARPPAREREREREEEAKNWRARACRDKGEKICGHAGM